MKRLITISTALAAVLLASPVLAAPVKVVASFSVLGDLVQQVGGPNVDVVTLVGPNGDAHTFEPTPADAKNVKSAKLVVINGLGLDPWLQRLIRSTGYKGAVTTATAGIKPRMGFEEKEEGGDHAKQAQGDEGDHGHSGIDPHAWQNVANVKVYVKNIVDGLSKVDPSHAADYRSSGDAYAHKLDQLDQEVRAAFAKIPRSERKIITSHDAFGYYGDAYGLTLLAPEGLSTEAEPSARAVAALIDQIRREHIKAIFVENVTDPRLIERIAKESGAKVGGELFSDALSPKDGPAATYIDMVRHNTGLITAALAGQS
jgi:zinc/manganese transport system substrate-binding protein